MVERVGMPPVCSPAPAAAPDRPGAPPGFTAPRGSQHRAGEQREGRDGAEPEHHEPELLARDPVPSSVPSSMPPSTAGNSTSAMWAADAVSPP